MRHLNQTIKLAVIYDLANVRILLNIIKNGEKYHFVEVMTCPGGYIGNGGQPKHFYEDEKAQKERIKSLYTKDSSMKLRLSHENPEIIAPYKDYLIKPHSDRAIELLHTMYLDRIKYLRG